MCNVLTSDLSITADLSIQLPPKLHVDEKRYDAKDDREDEEDKNLGAEGRSAD